jgi:hypothetical protein
MSVQRFTIPGHATKREFAIYAVVAKKLGTADCRIYVGKTGDNRSGCNPVVSRAGNHFSYNDVHSQVRSKLAPFQPHEFDFEYFYVTFHAYAAGDGDLRIKIDTINEMERAANVAVYEALPEEARGDLMNRYKGTGYVSKAERAKRSSLRSEATKQKIMALAKAVGEHVRDIRSGQ